MVKAAQAVAEGKAFDMVEFVGKINALTPEERDAVGEILEKLREISTQTLSILRRKYGTSTIRWA